MTYNPYGAPAAQAPIAPVPQGPPGTPQPWEAGEVVGRSWEIVKMHWVPLIIGIVIGNIAASTPQYVASIYNVAAHGGGNQYPFEDPIWVALFAGGIVFGQVVQAFFQAGYAKMYLTAARGGTPEISDIFGGASRFLPMLGALVLWFIIFAVGLMLLVVPGVIFGLGTMLYPYYVVERGMGPIEALQASWDATTGQKGKLFVLSLCWFGISIVGMVACCVGTFASLAVIMLTQAIVYVRLTGTEAGYGPQPPAYGGYGGGYGGYGPPPPQQPPGGFGYGPR